MGLKDLVSKAEQLTEAATGAAEKLVDEFNEALPTMTALGFTVKDLRVGMGLLPEINAILEASADAVDPTKIKELMDNIRRLDGMAWAVRLTAIFLKLQRDDRIREVRSAATHRFCDEEQGRNPPACGLGPSRPRKCS